LFKWWQTIIYKIKTNHKQNYKQNLQKKHKLFLI
jgi:hypothetical protein